MKICSVEGCNRKHHGKGYCNKHLHQIQRHGKITPERERNVYTPDSKCMVEGCNNRPHSFGLCNKHYLQIRRHGKTSRRTRLDNNQIILHKDYAEIVLYDFKQNKKASAFIDIEDVEKISEYRWSLTWSTRGGLYVCNSKVGRLHRFITNAPPGKVVDHINHDVLDNRKANLRICTQSDNCKNVRLRSGSTTGFKGVYYNKKSKKYYAEIHVNKKKIYLGSSYDINEVAKRRRAAELKYYGEFATKEVI